MPNSYTDPNQTLRAAIMHLAGRNSELLSHAARPWATISFVGSRHTIVLQFTGLEAERNADGFILKLPDHKLTITGFLVCDVEVTSKEYVARPAPSMKVELEVLVLNDDANIPPKDSRYTNVTAPSIAG